MAQINANILAVELFSLRSARMEACPQEALRRIEEIINVYTKITHEADGVVYLLSGYSLAAGEYIEQPFPSRNEALKHRNDVLGIHWEKLEKISAYGDIELIKKW